MCNFTRYFERTAFFLVLVLVTSCSSYRFNRLEINGEKEHEFKAAGCVSSLRVVQNETLGSLALQFQLQKGMTVHLNHLKLSLNGELVPVGKVRFRYAGKMPEGDFTAERNGTFTASLEQNAIANGKHLQLLPSDFITCKAGNLIRETLEINTGLPVE